MYAFNIEDGDIKIFMNKLLTEDTFDSYEVRNIELETMVKYQIDGKINKDYLAENEERIYCKWGELRHSVYGLIKGSKKPKVFKLVFALTKERVEILHPNGSAMFINIMFENDRVGFITGSSQKEFTLEKSVDLAWEEYVKKYFKKLGLTAIEV